MGKNWDKGVPGVPFWEQALRVAKPGAHILACGGSRTFHRLVCAIEDAGWEIRDVIMWVYGNGFPKSLDVSKGIDKAKGLADQRGYVEPTGGLHGGSGDAGGCFTGQQLSDDPVSEEATHWQGWKTCIKPAYEPIVLARKPFEGTVVENVLEHGTGALNVDACRVGDELLEASSGEASSNGKYGDRKWSLKERKGRYPANVIHDGSQEIRDVLPPEIRRLFYVPKPDNKERDRGLKSLPDQQKAGEYRLAYHEGEKRIDKSKPRKNAHPTVKPVKLMRYLCRLITPKGGLVLDPFMGSGSTGVAALQEGFRFLGIELNAEGDYIAIAENRLKAVRKSLLN